MSNRIFILLCAVAIMAATGVSISLTHMRQANAEDFRAQYLQKLQADSAPIGIPNDVEEDRDRLPLVTISQ